MTDHLIAPQELDALIRGICERAGAPYLLKPNR